MRMCVGCIQQGVNQNETDGLTTNPIFVLLCWTPNMGGNMNGQMGKSTNRNEDSKIEAGLIPIFSDRQLRTEGEI